MRQPVEDAAASADISTGVISALPSHGATQQMLHYLQLQQIELAAQNEQLHLSQFAQGSVPAIYLDLYDNAPVGYCTLSEEGVIQQANITAANLLGVARDELRNRVLSCFLVKEDQDRYFQHRKQIIATGGPLSVELRLERSDGTRCWVHLVASAVQNADGVRVLRVILNNITEIKKMAALALHESQHLAQAVLDSMPFQIAVLDHDGIIIAVNEAWQQFALENSNVPGQVARNTQIGTSYLDICRASLGLFSDGAADAGTGILAVLEGRLPRFNLDYLCPSPSQSRWFTLFVTPMVEHGVVVTHVDITARKVAEENLAQHRDALVREVHHRIKNNLQGVAGLLHRELGKFQGLDPRLAAAISQVNAVAIVHGLQADHPDESIRLDDSIRHICTMVAELAQHPVRFRIERKKSFRPVRIDSNEAVSVALVLNELILNAVKHSSDASSPPLVSLAADGFRARVVIRNPVTGMPDFNIATGEGLGTGLSLVRSLLPKEGTHLSYALDSRGFILATLSLAAPVVVAAIDKEKI